MSDDWYAALHSPGHATLFEPIYRCGERTLALLRGVPTAVDDGLAAGGGRTAPARWAGREIERDRVCLPRVLRAAREPRCGLPVALEVHAVTLERDPTLPELILWLAETNAVDTHRLVLIVAGHRSRAVGRATTTALDRLRAAGVRVGLGDVGSRQAISPSFLECAPDLLVLDRGLAGGCAASPRRLAALAGVVELGSELGVAVVAQGVEQPADLEALEQLGVRYVGGALLGRPAPMEHWAREPEQWAMGVGASAPDG